MKKIKKTYKRIDYIKTLQTEALRYHHLGSAGGYCGVLSLALCSGREFEDLVIEFMSRKKRPWFWKGGTNIKERRSVLDHYGIKYRYKRYRRSRRMKLSDFVRNHDRSKLYSVVIHKHVVTAYKGVIYDNNHICWPYGSYFRNRKVISYIEIDLENQYYL